MTEEIIKECKNCDALGFDSEIGVYYCCLSHRQDDLPKEFTCDDFVPNKQLLRLEQENKESKAENEKYKQALEEIRKQYINKAFFKCDKTEEECPCHNCIILGQLDRVQNIVKIIDEVLNDRD